MTTRLFIIVMLIPLLVACGGGSSSTRPTTSRGEPIADQHAHQLMNQGEFRAAADAYLAVSARVSRSQGYDYRLNAADALIKAGDRRRARQLLKKLAGSGLSQQQMLTRDMLAASLFIEEHRPYAALKLLEHRVPHGLSNEIQHTLSQLKMEAYTQAGNHIEAARERVKLELFISDVKIQQENREQIWALLDKLHPLILEQTRPPAPSTLGGWMELVALAKQYASDPTAHAAAVTHWRQRYPGHPGGLEVVGELEQAMQAEIMEPTDIALLLPLSGRYAGAAAAVRDGFMTAWYQDQSRPRVTIHDSNPAQLWQIYQDVVDAGASVVVGPLDKQSLKQLYENDSLPVPTLALNRFEPEDTPDKKAHSPPSNLYQFGLSPEEEARQIAERAWQDGHTRAAVLTPDTDWGKRVAQAFSQAWLQTGGIVIESGYYSGTDSHLARSVEKLLNVNRSKLRARQLRDRLARGDIQTEERRRQDIDFVFLAAFPKQARQLKPQFSFFRASRVPIYSTSHIFTGRIDARADRDLNGLIFGDMPWILSPEKHGQDVRKQIAKNWPDALDRYNRLFALGIDAYRLIPHLARLQRYRFAFFQGLTGRLRTDDSGTLYRQLTWASFKKGKPYRLDTDAPIN